MEFISDSIKPSHHGGFGGELNPELRIKVYFIFNPATMLVLAGS